MFQAQWQRRYFIKFLKMLVKLICYFGLKNTKEFVRLLAKLEYGVSSALNNLAEDADKSNYPNLAAMLRAHSSEEFNHGRMLATWCDGKNSIRLRGAGRMLSWKNSAGVELARFPESKKGTKIVLDKEGEQYIGIFENLDGISQRYLALKIFLRGKKIIELPWKDRLACMLALEGGTRALYVELSKLKMPESLRAIFSKIAQEESSHSDYLESVLRDFVPCPSQEVDRWKGRISLASLGLIYDFGKFLMERRSAS